MRATSFSVHGDQRIEVFVWRRRSMTELWVVGPWKGQRAVLDHQRTHDDLERRLAYATPGDLAWRDCCAAELPERRHPIARFNGQLVSSGHCWDAPQPGVAYHVMNGLDLDDGGRARLAEARAALVGTWSDGAFTLVFAVNGRLQWTRQQRRPVWDGFLAPETLDRWGFDRWGLGLLASATRTGTSARVIRVDDRELHLSRFQSDAIARVFRRVSPLLRAARDAGTAPAPLPAAAPLRLDARSSVWRQLDAALAVRHPTLHVRLKPGLGAARIHERLTRAGVTGHVAPLVAFFAWHDGAKSDARRTILESGILPESPYALLSLHEALAHRRALLAAIDELRGGTAADGLGVMGALHQVTPRRIRGLWRGIHASLCPILSHASGPLIAVDGSVRGDGTVVSIDLESGSAVRRIAPSLDRFTAALVRNLVRGTLPAWAM